MFGQKEDGIVGGDNQMSGLLEPGCEFEGKLTFQDTVCINGNFRGEIFSKGTLIVGEGAVLDARIEVGNLVISGHVTGEIEAEDRIEMRAPAQVRGNITARTLVVEEGVLFEGTCKMGQGPAITMQAQEAGALRSANGNDAEEGVGEVSSLI